MLQTKVRLMCTMWEIVSCCIGKEVGIPGFLGYSGTDGRSRRGSVLGGLVWFHGVLFGSMVHYISHDLRPW